MSTAPAADPRLPDFATLQLPPDCLAEHVIALTGVTDGLGRALAIACAAHGAQVLLLGRTLKRLEAVEREINALGRYEALLAPFDLEKAVAADYDQIAEAIGERFGRLDGLVHAAALVGNLAPVEHYDVPQWCRLLHVNLTAPFALTQVLLPLLRTARDASVVFATCVQSAAPGPYWGAYAASKAGLDALMRSLAAEWDADKGPRVNSVDPGPMRTRLRRQAYPSGDLDLLPPPEARTSVFLWLLSAAAGGVHGQRIVVD